MCFCSFLPNSQKFRLKNYIKKIQSTNTTLTPADKTSNMYKITSTQYNQLVTNAITKTYKKAKENISDQINSEGKKIAEKKKITNKINVNGKNECFITLKDHKQNFEKKLPTRLINPAKNEIGRISKVVIENVNSILRKEIKLQQWKNTSDVIHWFENIKEKHKCKFMMFDIKEFYPSITEDLLKKSINHAKRYVNISNTDIEIITHARKSLLYNNGEPWVKRNNEDFDVTMGAYDGAEICEIVGIYLLSLLTKKYSKEDIGLYRDDGLAVFRNISGKEADTIRKHFSAVFKLNGLSLEIECNQKIVNYLDVTLNLEDGTYRPFRKPNEVTTYIHAKSNHPTNIIKQLPISIEKRISNLSINQEVFNEASTHYQEALNKCGYTYKISYQPDKNNAKEANKHNRKRNIIWFNPPFSKNVRTNVGKYFLNLVKKHFPKQHIYHKLFNRNNLKISYSCTPNMNKTINAHNKNITKEKPAPTKSCNCTKRNECPLNNNCLKTNIVYKTTLTSDTPNNTPKTYIGISEGPFKLRYANHKKSFNHRKYINDTELSKEVWKIKDRNETPILTWEILKKCAPYNPNTNKCNLCLTEKLCILHANQSPNSCLNKRNELISKCRHQNKFSLNNHAEHDVK